jgi:hypothetical protein
MKLFIEELKKKKAYFKHSDLRFFFFKYIFSHKKNFLNNFNLNLIIRNFINKKKYFTLR